MLAGLKSNKTKNAHAHTRRGSLPTETQSAVQRTAVAFQHTDKMKARVVLVLTVCGALLARAIAAEEKNYALGLYTCSTVTAAVKD